MENHSEKTDTSGISESKEFYNGSRESVGPKTL